MYLSAHSVVSTEAPDEAEAEIARIFCPHRLEARGEGFFARHNSCAVAGRAANAPPTGCASINYVRYGGEVDIDPGELAGFFLLQLPVSGGATVRCGASLAQTAPGAAASLVSPTLPTRMTWRDSCGQLILLLPRDLVERRGRALFGGDGLVEFDARLDLRGPVGAMLHAQLHLLAALAGRGRAGVEKGGRGDILAAETVDAVIGALLAGQGSNLTRAAARAPATRAAGGAAFARAREFIAANLDRRIEAEEIAAAAGTGLRALQKTARRVGGVSLTGLVRDMRFARLRALLDAAPDDARVSDLMLAAGLDHFGRAAEGFRRRYGAAPSGYLAERRTRKRR